MSIWMFDENRADFRPALPGEIEADPDALYIVQRGDVLMVREDGRERPMPERLDVAGVVFDREQFTRPLNGTTRTAIAELEVGKGTVFDAANRRGEDMKATFPAAVAVRYDRRISRVVISLASGLQIAFAPRDAQGLENAHPADLVDAEISPSGLGVHFPKLDADLYIPALLEGFLGSKRWRNGKRSFPAKYATDE